jgi:osmoprotectant transport system substrate-binding protein
VRAVCLVLAVALLSGGCVGEQAEPAADVVVGVGSTDEQRVLAALTVVALRQAGIDTEVRTELGGTIELRREALRDDIDVFWDYTGAAWALGLRQQAPPAAPDESFERVRSADEELGLTWLAPTEANATLALFVRAEDLPADPQPRGMTWLAAELSGGERQLCADPDFITRPGGLEALAAAYAIDRNNLELEFASEAEAIAGVASGLCYAGLATATSGEARAAGLVPAADDLMVFPAFVVAPVARADALADTPGVVAALAPVVDRLDTAALAALNARVAGGADPEDLAEELLAGA